MVEFGQSGCVRARQLYISKLVVLGQNWLYSEKVVFNGQNCCIPENGCIRLKVVVFGKVVVFRQRWLYLDKNG